jgi:AraC family transcriptional regulator of arabinose operon
LTTASGNKTADVDLAWFSLAVAGSITYPAGGTHGPRRLDGWQLVLLHSGSVRIDTGSRVIMLEPGEVCLLAPGARDLFHFSKVTPSWHRWVTLYLSGPDAPLSWRLPEQAKIKLPAALNGIVDAMLQLQLSGTAYDDVGLRCLAVAAMACYLADAGKRAARLSPHPALERMHGAIRAGFGSALSLEDLARAAGLSREYLIRLCRRVYGQTPMQLVWTHRFERALDLLRNTGLSVGDIAERCGFAACQHFTRLIRRRTGLTPTQIRRQALQP